MNDSKPSYLVIVMLSTLIFTMCSTTKKITAKKDLYKHLIYYPESYEASNGEDFPLMIFLHGAGERGADISKVEVHGPPMQIKNGETFPCIVVSPQCPADLRWEVDRLENLLQYILKNNRIDKQRIYLTGLSMGGYGTWAWSIAHPEHFAAIVPICGGGETENISRIKDIPVWVFHGAQDNVIPLERSQKMVDALMAIGGKPNFTIYPKANHDSWTVTYNNAKVYEWMYAQEKN